MSFGGTSAAAATVSGVAALVLARARTLWVYVDMKTGKAIPIPDEMRAAFPVIPDDQVSVRLGVDAAARVA